jgi:predicted naringenin-chalcone synthase
MKSKIISIGTAVPEHSSPQQNILEFMQKAYNNPLAGRKLQALFRTSGIEKRHSVVPDFGNGSPPSFFLHQHQQPHVQERMLQFGKHSVDLSVNAINETLGQTAISPSEITHLITVTCTGLTAPGLNTEIINRLELNNDVQNTAINFIGCGAAFHGLKQADFIARAEKKAKVLVVCVELCTLHFQPKDTSDHLLSNTIFGDGAAVALVVPGENTSKGFKIEGFYSVLLPAGESLMGWHVHPMGFEMILNAKLPAFIKTDIADIIDKASSHYHQEPSEIQHWAVHPGGKAILDKVGEALEFLNGEMEYSYNVLRNYGNMSSATILFVLKQIMESTRPGEKTLAVGFGPGLTTETALFTYA